MQWHHQLNKVYLKLPSYHHGTSSNLSQWLHAAQTIPPPLPAPVVVHLEILTGRCGAACNRLPLPCAAELLPVQLLEQVWRLHIQVLHSCFCRATLPGCYERLARLAQAHLRGQVVWRLL